MLLAMCVRFRQRSEVCASQTRIRPASLSWTDTTCLRLFLQDMPLPSRYFELWGRRKARQRVEGRGTVFRFPAGPKNFLLFQNVFTAAGGPLCLLIKACRRPRGRGHGAEHSRSSTAKVKNVWTYTSNPSYAVTTWTGTTFFVYKKGKCALNVTCLWSSGMCRHVDW